MYSKLNKALPDGVKKLRTPALILALIFMFGIVLLESGGSNALISWFTGKSSVKRPGYGIEYLYQIDMLLLYTLVLMTLPVFKVPQKIQGQFQGALTLIIGFIYFFKNMALAFKALAAMVMMIALLLAFPFGTIAYMAKFASFDKSGAAGSLSTIMTFKYIFVICILIAHQEFLKNLGFVLLVATSFIAMIVVGFLHGFMPRILCSITDAISGIVLAIIAMIWCVIFVLGSIIPVIKALRVDKMLK